MATPQQQDTFTHQAILRGARLLLEDRISDTVDWARRLNLVLAVTVNLYEALDAWASLSLQGDDLTVSQRALVTAQKNLLDTIQEKIHRVVQVTASQAQPPNVEVSSAWLGAAVPLIQAGGIIDQLLFVRERLANATTPPDTTIITSYAISVPLIVLGSALIGGTPLSWWLGVVATLAPAVGLVANTPIVKNAIETAKQIGEGAIGAAKAVASGAGVLAGAAPWLIGGGFLLFVLSRR